MEVGCSVNWGNRMMAAIIIIMLERLILDSHEDSSLLNVLIALLGNFDFKFHANQTRLLCR
jgi:hypothetical protein